MSLFKKKRRRGRPRKINPFKDFNKDSPIKKLSHLIPFLSVIIGSYFYFVKNIPLYDDNVPFNGVIPMVGLGGIVYIIFYAFMDADDLTNNVKANKFFSPFIFLVVLSVTQFKLKIPFFSSAPNVPFYGAFPLALLFTFIYLYASSYFQPDLDINGSRPGRTHFPVGKWITMFRSGRFLKWLTRPIAEIWFRLWGPYGLLFTHRGVGHYPVIGTWTRAAYMWLVFYSINFILGIINLKFNFLINSQTWFASFFPFHNNFMNSLVFWITIFPIFISDFVHISVDYIDAVKRGMPFCPPKLARGVLITFWNELLENIKKI